MQVLKDELKKKLLEAALDEFKKKGFQKSSMRSIAKKSGMTVGNLYRYFRNKEDLFDAVVRPSFNKILEIINELSDLSDMRKNGFGNFMEYTANCIVEYQRKFKQQYVILLYGSKGTKYEQAKQNIILLIEDCIKERLFKDVEANGSVIKDYFLANAIATAFFEGLAKIISHYKDECMIKSVISQYVAFYFKHADKRFA
ncbi:MAG: TetR/AcrR family transcriptional regulator [Firmicutes bacterium]|nr:TetR/AcrR family transcriptional regulator [Bacillota bacterium]